MKIFTSSQIRSIDSLTIEKEPVASIDLMERAAMQLLNFMTNKFSPQTKVALFAGPGNNGGDAVALARLLSNKQYDAELFTIDLGGKLSNDNKTNLERLTSCGIVIHNLDQSTANPDLSTFDVLIDGIFGSGLSRPITHWPAALIHHINESNKTVVSIDIPSGLFSEDNTNNSGTIICASYTVSFQFPKLAFMLPENEKSVGKWQTRPIGLFPEGIRNEATKYYYTTYSDLPNLINRSHFSHKGNFGHALLIAGSYGMTGAAILAAKSCLRSGVGLLSVHVPQSAYSIMQSAVPEAMVVIDETEQIFCTKEALEKYNCIAIGPGIGMKQSMKEGLSQLLANANVPVVLDADALNIIAEQKSLLETIPASSIITPHPKEFDRLTRTHQNHFQRIETAIEMATQQQLTVVLKGAHTAVITSAGDVHFNSTGNPGLAKGGSGDALTGIILGLLANKYTTENAALLGVFIHGLAADIAVDHIATESLITSDVIDHISQAFASITNRKPHS